MVVITYPTALPNEASLINQMLEKGLPLLHVRKPFMDVNQLEDWLGYIENTHTEKLVIHIQSKFINRDNNSFEHYIRLINSLNSHYLHLSTELVSFVNNYTSQSLELSTSTHCITDVNNLSTHIKRAFISPIYPSISKKGYFSPVNWTDEISLRTNKNVSLIALGGICPSNIQAVKSMGFDDYALLGTIWESNNPLKQFELCQHYDQLYWH